MPSKKKKYSARFPPARIKKIMQTDEEVGKVASAVPVIISRALELFIENLIKKSADTTRSKNAKTLSTQHIKQTIHGDKQFDFLQELVKNVPDVQAAEDADGHHGDQGDTSGPKPRGRPRKKKGEEAIAPQPKRRKVGRKESTETDSATEEADTEEDDDMTSLSSTSLQAATSSGVSLNSQIPAALGAAPSEQEDYEQSNETKSDSGTEKLPFRFYNSEINDSKPQEVVKAEPMTIPIPRIFSKDQKGEEDTCDRRVHLPNLDYNTYQDGTPTSESKNDVKAKASILQQQLLQATPHNDSATSSHSPAQQQQASLLSEVKQEAQPPPAAAAAAAATSSSKSTFFRPFQTSPSSQKDEPPRDIPAQVTSALSPAGLVEDRPPHPISPAAAIRRSPYPPETQTSNSEPPTTAVSVGAGGGGVYGYYPANPASQPVPPSQGNNNRSLYPESQQVPPTQHLPIATTSTTAAASSASVASPASNEMPQDLSRKASPALSNHSGSLGRPSPGLQPLSSNNSSNSGQDMPQDLSSPRGASGARHSPTVTSAAGSPYPPPSAAMPGLPGLRPGADAAAAAMHGFPMGHPGLPMSHGFPPYPPTTHNNFPYPAAYPAGAMYGYYPAMAPPTGGAASLHHMAAMGQNLHSPTKDKNS